MTTSQDKNSKKTTKSTKVKQPTTTASPKSGEKRGRKPSGCSGSKSSSCSSSAQEPKEKDYYKVLNGRAYTQSVIKRGDFSLFIEDDLYAKWIYAGKRQPGGAVLYSNEVIELGLIIRKLFRLPYRQTQGFLKGLLSMLGWAVPVPNYSTLNRRSATLQVDIANDVAECGDVYVSMDSTGLKVSGEGEWKMKKHGKSKRRTWRKLHVLMDASGYQILQVHLTTNAVDDGSVVADLFADGKGCKACGCYADGAYDQELVRKFLYQHGISQIIPPQRGAVMHIDKPHLQERNKAIAFIAEDHEKRTQWKQHNGYHQRSLVEVEMLRFKTIFGDKLLSLKMPYQQTEVRVAAKILNVFTALGMPISVKVDRQRKETQKQQKLKLKQDQEQQQKQLKEKQNQQKYQQKKSIAAP